MGKRLACHAVLCASLALASSAFGQGGEGATPDTGAAGEGAGGETVADKDAAAPLVVAEPQVDAPADKGQAGQELRDAHYRVQKDTTVATVKRKRRSAPRPPEDLRAGVSLAAGSVVTPSIDQGWYGRLDMAALVGKRKGLFGGTVGADVGFEYWSSDNGSGGGIPAAVTVGALGPLSHFALDLGFEFLVDDRNDDMGFGIYSPFARGKLGFDFGPVMILAESQIQYRWQWGADDYTDYRLGLNIKLLGEPDPPLPNPKAGD